MDHEQLCEATFTARNAVWTAFGEPDPYVLAPMINPAFTGWPVWPNLRQAYRVVHGPLGTLVATDGLADPFDDSWKDPPDQQGFAVEAYAIADRLPNDLLRGSWLFAMVLQVSALVAQNGHVHELLDELGTVSTELYDVPIPDEHRATFVNDEGRVGVLVGLDVPPYPARFAGPAGPVRVANLKLLTLAELAWIVGKGDEGRAEVARRLLATPAALVSSLTRKSVV